MSRRETARPTRARASAARCAATHLGVVVALLCKLPRKLGKRRVQRRRDLHDRPGDRRPGGRRCPRGGRRCGHPTAPRATERGPRTPVSSPRFPSPRPRPRAPPCTKVRARPVSGLARSRGARLAGLQRPLGSWGTANVDCQSMRSRMLNIPVLSLHGLGCIPFSFLLHELSQPRRCAAACGSARPRRSRCSWRPPRRPPRQRPLSHPPASQAAPGPRTDARRWPRARAPAASAPPRSASCPRPRRGSHAARARAVLRRARACVRACVRTRACIPAGVVASPCAVSAPGGRARPAASWSSVQ